MKEREIYLVEADFYLKIELEFLSLNIIAWSLYVYLLGNNAENKNGESNGLSSKEKSSIYQNQTIDHPCHFSSSIYYGGQEVYSPQTWRPTQSHPVVSVINCSGHKNIGPVHKSFFVFCFLKQISENIKKVLGLLIPIILFS